MKNKKKFFSLLMMIVMMFSMSLNVFAWQPSFIYVKSVDDLINMSKASAGTYYISEHIDIEEDLVLEGNVQGVTGAGKSISVKSGATLTIDMPNFEFMGNGYDSHVIEVEEGGHLILKRGAAQVIVSDPVKCSAFKIKEGGECKIYKDTFKLYTDETKSINGIFDGEYTFVDKDGNEIPVESENPGGSENPGNPDNPDNPDGPNTPVDPEIPEKDYIKTEVAEVKEGGVVHIFVTFPTPETVIESITIQKKVNDEWMDSLKYDLVYSVGDLIYENKETLLSSWSHTQRPYSFLRYTEQWTEDNAGKETVLRIKYNDSDKEYFSDETSIVMPDTGNIKEFNINFDEYNIVDGNRGGIGQGESDREPDIGGGKPGDNQDQNKDPDSGKDPESKPGADDKEEQESKPGSGNKPESKPESGNKPESKPESGNKPESKPGSENKPESKPESGNKPESKPESGNKPESKPGSGNKPESSKGSETNTGNNEKLEVKSNENGIKKDNDLKDNKKENKKPGNKNDAVVMNEKEVEESKGSMSMIPVAVVSTLAVAGGAAFFSTGGVAKLRRLFKIKKK